MKTEPFTDSKCLTNSQRDSIKKMNIYLLGYMGCGKTSTAKRLASYSQRNFVDLDDCFEAAHGAIGEYFKKQGETAFREAERQLLHECGQLTDSIIALGGGTPCFGDNMDWLLRHGFTVYLKMNELALLQRLSNTRKKRPLLANLTDGEMLSFIGEQLKQRAPFYERAHLSYPGINVKTAELWREIECGIQLLTAKATSEATKTTNNQRN